MYYLFINVNDNDLHLDLAVVTVARLSRANDVFALVSTV